MPPKRNPERLRIADDQPLPESVKTPLTTAERLLLVSDFDGTLAEITDEPDRTRMHPDVTSPLSHLAQRPDAGVAVVSGRALADVESRIDIEGVCYAGNHGLEIETDGQSFVHPAARGRKEDISDVCDTLSSELDTIEGALVENKGLTATIHYRMVTDQRDVDHVRDIVRSAIEPRPKLQLTEGRQIVEIRPDVDWNKGRALEWITENLSGGGSSPYRVYLGDDVSDEDAFRALEAGEFGILVGESADSTDARYRLESPDEVAAFLEHLVDLRAQ